MSRTLRVSAPYVRSRTGSQRAKPGVKPRPRLGLSPTMPHHAAGTRIEPAPSLPCARGTTRAATSAPAPPDEPPGLCARLQGLCVGPCSSGSVVPVRPDSGEALMPRLTRPVSRKAATKGSVRVGRFPAHAREPWSFTAPARSSIPFTNVGTPVKGPASGRRALASAAS